MGSHTKPERSPLLARCEFDGLVRGDHQKVQDYVAKIKHVAVDCKFSAAVRDERLRDRFVSGVRDDIMVAKLLTKKMEELNI